MSREILIVKSTQPPVVEIDTSVASAYVRFKSAKIERTISEDKPGVVVAIDLDGRGDVVGVELLGVKEFGISYLLKLTHVKTPNINLDRARYVGAGRSSLVPA